MWNPGFPFLAKEKARLSGFHRAFCIYSHHYRGTPENPGLVLGLDIGGTCDGVAYRVGPDDWQGVVDYLNERELIGYAYKPVAVEVLLGARAQMIEAYTFVADPGHPTYAGDLGQECSADTIMHAQGAGGLNRDYLINTIKQLETHGYKDPPLRLLLQKIEYMTGMIDQGGGI